ncbi:OB-fold protein [Tenacibaculum amylolyticum]|uniref:OB-fold protein n=1 Tax=Tenacibaculum amylolyticum TaxID=104269 RepID=UPI003893D809
MQRRYYILLSIISILLVGYLLYYFLYNNSLQNIVHKAPEFSLESNELLDAYMTNEMGSEKKYTDKVITVHGTIKEISFFNNRTTIVLNSNIPDAGIICDLDDSQSEKIKHLKENQELYVKGVCKGYLKDVILLNCFIDTKKNYE